MAVKSPQPDDARPGERAAELLAAACRTIARDGTRKLSMRDVAEEAGVSKALLHYYFSSRNDLLARAYEFSNDRGRARVWGDVAAVESGSVRLSRLLDLYLSDDPQISEDWVLWSELSSTAMFEGELRPVMEAAFAGWCAWIEALVRDAIAEGSVPADSDPLEAALRLIALTDGLGSLVVRGLIGRDQARAALQRHLDIELRRTPIDEATRADRPRPPATGYLRLLASLTRQAVTELRGLATTPEEEEAIRTVSALIDSRTVSTTSPAAGS